MTESWHLKLQRADAHLTELLAVMADARNRATIHVDERVDDDLYRYSLRVGLDVPEILPVIIGDALFNLRSALDHIAVANVPAKRRRSASFPILLVDPKVSPGAMRTWLEATTGMKNQIVAIVDRAQPFHEYMKKSGDVGEPEETALGLLSYFQNADKHRELIVVLDGLTDFVASHSLDPEPKSLGEHGMLPNGGSFLTSGTPLDVSASGSIDFALRRGKRHHRLAEVLQSIRGEVGAVIAVIDEAMAETPWPVRDSKL